MGWAVVALIPFILSLSKDCVQTEEILRQAQDERGCVGLLRYRWDALGPSQQARLCSVIQQP